MREPDAGVIESVPPARHAWLGVVMCLTLAPRAIDEVIGSSVAATLKDVPGHQWFAYLTALAQAAGLLAAGLAVDRGFGSAVVFSLLAWAVATATSAVLPGWPLALYLSHVVAVIAGCVFGIAVPVVAKLAFPLWRRARVLALFNVAATAWLLLLPSYLEGGGWPPNSLSQPAWTEGCLAIGGLAAGLALVWWMVVRRPSGEATRPTAFAGGILEQGLAEAAALLRRPGIFALMVVMTCHMQVFAMIHRVVAPYMISERLFNGLYVTLSAAPPLVGSLVAQIIFAHWSDRLARRGASAAAARLPFIVVGAVLSASIALLPSMSRGGIDAVFWILAIGMALFPLAFALGFDIVPRAQAGAFLGLVSAFSVGVNAALFLVAGSLSARLHSLSIYFWLAGIAALVGACTAAIGLRHIEPIEDASHHAIGKVFA